MKRLAVFGFAVLMGLSLVGVASASWSSDVRMQGKVKTGRIEGHFDGVEIIEGKKIDATVSADGHFLTVNMWNKNDNYRVRFSVENVGTIPLKVVRIHVNTPPGVTVATYGEGTVVGVGDSETEFEAAISMTKAVAVPAQVTLTLDCRVWLY